MFQLGLQYSVIDKYDSNMNKLLGIRNAIAHGDRLKIPSEKEVGDYTETPMELMRFLQGEIYSALTTRAYLKPSA